MSKVRIDSSATFAHSLGQPNNSHRIYSQDIFRSASLANASGLPIKVEKRIVTKLLRYLVRIDEGLLRDKVVTLHRAKLDIVVNQIFIYQISCAQDRD